MIKNNKTIDSVNLYFMKFEFGLKQQVNDKMNDYDAVLLCQYSFYGQYFSKTAY